MTRLRLRQPLLFAAMVFAISASDLLASPRNAAGAVTIVDVDLKTGSESVSGPDRDVASTPGSTLKPIVLLSALRMGVVTPGTRVACRGSLKVASRNLACTHPTALGVLDAEEALAYSCNTYFAQVAQQLSPAALQQSLRAYGIHAEGVAGTPEERILLALGLERVAVTPLQLAHAYAELAKALQQDQANSFTVREGLLGSVAYGMAHAAQTPGAKLGGKTGTAHDPAPRFQHGWFAGIAFSVVPPFRATHVLVVYAPGGNGNDAALAAHEYVASKRWRQ